MLYELLGMNDEPTGGLDWHDRIVEGFRPASITALARGLKVRPDDVCGLVGLDATVLGKTRRSSRLSSQDSNYLYRIADAFLRLRVPLKSHETCVSWLRSAQPTLKGRIPVLLLASHIGTEYVMAAIARLPVSVELQRNAAKRHDDEEGDAAEI